MKKLFIIVAILLLVSFTFGAQSIFTASVDFGTVEVLDEYLVQQGEVVDAMSLSDKLKAASKSFKKKVKRDVRNGRVNADQKTRMDNITEVVLPE
jgi:hypothetical protein